MRPSSKPNCACLARYYIARERPDHTLQPTAIVHEAYIRHADFRSLHRKNRTHFFAISAQVMRRVLVDFARSRVPRKRGGAAQRVSLDEIANLGAQHDAALLALDDALAPSPAEDPRKCQVVEMKFFGGLSTDEISQSLNVSPETVQRDWKIAKLWLLRQTDHEALRIMVPAARTSAQPNRKAIFFIVSPCCIFTERLQLALAKWLRIIAIRS